MKFHLVNASTLIKDLDVLSLFARACEHQLQVHAAPRWRWTRTDTVDVAADPSHIPPGEVVMGLYDDSDQADALGWHTEDGSGKIFGRVFVRPVFESGGDLYTNPTESVSSVLSHEILETRGDPYVVDWYQRQDGTLVAAELGDPVQGDNYMVNVMGKFVRVSNFILPAWRDAFGRGPFDYLGKLRHAFGMTPGGYMITQEAGAVSEVFGAEVPAWKREAILSGKSARASRRRC